MVDRFPKYLVLSHGAVILAFQHDKVTHELRDWRSHVDILQREVAEKDAEVLRLRYEYF